MLAGTTRFDVVLDALSNVYRRRLLVALLSTSTFTLDDEWRPLTRGDADLDVLHQQLFHVHLPKLAEAGFVEWDPTRDVVTAGERFEEVVPLLRLIEAHADELPDGWL